MIKSLNVIVVTYDDGGSSTMSFLDSAKHQYLAKARTKVRGCRYKVG
jgi:hypothetical protein